MHNPPLRDDDSTQETQILINSLVLKVDTTPRWRCRFIYENMLQNARAQLVEQQLGHYRLDLCYKHRQEGNMSHFSTRNCHHCQLLAELLKTQRENTHDYSDLAVAQLGHYRLDLCKEHRQEDNHRHFSTGNCDHCQLIANLLKTQRENIHEPAHTIKLDWRE